jgi:inward rectifier potassium channel
MSKPVSVRAGQVEFLKVNTEGWDWRDAYQWLLALSWTRFALFIAGIYVAINLIFATLYSLRENCIAYLKPGSFVDAFFFSVQTLATVGYGHMYPQTLYGHIVTTIEIIFGMFGLG